MYILSENKCIKIDFCYQYGDSLPLPVGVPSLWGMDGSIFAYGVWQLSVLIFSQIFDF